jgi:hypothetical protein
MANPTVGGGPGKEQRSHLNSWRRFSISIDFFYMETHSSRSFHLSSKLSVAGRFPSNCRRARRDNLDCSTTLSTTGRSRSAGNSLEASKLSGYAKPHDWVRLASLIAIPGLIVAISPLCWSGSLHTMDVRPGRTSGFNNQRSILSLRNHHRSSLRVASTYRRVVDD